MYWNYHTFQFRKIVWKFLIVPILKNQIVVHLIFVIAYLIFVSCIINVTSCISVAGWLAPTTTYVADSRCLAGAVSFCSFCQFVRVATRLLTRLLCVPADHAISLHFVKPAPGGDLRSLFRPKKLAATTMHAVVCQGDFWHTNIKSVEIVVKQLKMIYLFIFINASNFDEIVLRNCKAWFSSQQVGMWS